MPLDFNEKPMNTEDIATPRSTETLPNRLLDGSKRRTALNQVYACGDIDASGARDMYSIWRVDHSISTGVVFQHGGILDPNDDEGVQDIDLLLMVEDRLLANQDGPFACDEYKMAIVAVQAAIKNLTDREERSYPAYFGSVETHL